MMDEKRLEQEYRRLKHQQAPDLWKRIEENLQEHPERNREGLKAEPDLRIAMQKAEKRRNSLPKRQVYGMATAAAAMLALLVTAPKLMEGRFEKSSDNMALTAAGGAAATEAISDAMAAEETEADMAAPQAAAGAGVAEAGAVEGAMPETAKQGNAGPGNVSPESAGPGNAGPGSAGTETDMARAEKAEEEAEITSKSSLAMNSGVRDDEGLSEERILPEGVLSYDQLKLAAYRPVAVPENAVTAAEDSQYFSEDILKDTQLLCGGTVTNVSFEQDQSGKAVKVVYEMTLDRVYFSEDYTAGMETITVKSPIVRTDGDEVYILYQLQAGGTYLLPLHKPEQDWELLYPFAPQIQVTGDGAYLFHSGYSSLMNEDTSVVIGSPEGDNDYFYDRMVLRADKDFLSELLALIEH